MVGLRDGSKRPLVSPRTTQSEVVPKIIYLRQNYHFGPQNIQTYVKRYHDISMSVSGIWWILKRLDMNRLPSSKRYKRHQDRWKRYEKPQSVPGSRSTSNSSHRSRAPQALTTLHRHRRWHTTARASSTTV